MIPIGHGRGSVPLCYWLLVALIWMDSGQMIWSLVFRANCGFPGKPYRANITPEEKMVYEDGEEISYKCTDFWAQPQTRKCVNGAWIGPPARCGMQWK